MEPFGKTIHEQHSEMVRQLVPREQLLEWHVEDGWEPLCEFLDKDVPAISFPRANDKGAFSKRVETDLEALGMTALRNMSLVFLGMATVACTFLLRLW